MTDGDFHQDRQRAFGRRGVLGLLGAALLAPSATGAATCLALPGETNGPYPGDGSNKAQGQISNVLVQDGVQRSDIRPSFAGLTPLADGIALNLAIRVTEAGDDCTPQAGRAVYVWHCDAAGSYSIYEVQDANYLRGLQISDADGWVRFTTILPGTYRGRYPHIHFEVFDSPDDAILGRNARLTSQIALPDADLQPIYAQDPRYAASLPALTAVTLESDMVFGDNSAQERAQQTLALTGTPDALSGTVTVPLG